ncbi:MAG: hypothetical protein ABH836_06050 [Candidatus Omnitrophota bacterium]
MTLYEEVLNIAQSYMGLAATEYLERRCRVSLGINNLENLKKEHLEKLAAAIEMTATVYISEEKVKQFKTEILALK